MNFLKNIYLILVLVFFGCSSSGIGDLDSLKEELNLTVLPTSDQYPDSDAIILDENHDVTLTITSDYNLEAKEEIRVAKKLFKNIDKHAFVEIDIYDGEELIEIEASTINPNGEVVNVKEEDFFMLEGSGGGSIFYTDKSSIRFTFPAVKKNCIVAFRFVKRKSRAFARDVWTIQKSVPVILNTYKLTVPTLLLAPRNLGGADWTWDYKFYNIKLKEPEFFKNLNVGGQRRTANVTFSWEQKNIEPVTIESNMPPFYDVAKYVRFKPHEWQKWSDISEWYFENFFKPQCIESDAIVQKSNDIVGNEKSDIGKIKSIFGFVQKLRYVAIELGEGSIKPSLPETVLERKYGDCKDKSNLLIAMLKSQGINANPVLINTLDAGTLDDSFPSWNFNHMIVYAIDSEGTEYWLDPTLEYAKVGELSSYCENVTAMIIKENGKCLMKKTPFSESLDNYTEISIKMDIFDDKSSKYFVNILYEGERNRSLKYFFKDASENDLIKYCKSLIIDDFTDVIIGNVEISEIENRYENLMLSFEATLPNSIRQQGDLHFLTVDPFKLDMSMKWLLKDKRINDIVFDYPFKLRKNIEVLLPNQFSVRNLPENLLSRNDHLYYEINYKKRVQNTIIIKEEFWLKSKKIPASNYSELKSFFSKVNLSNKDNLILLKK